MDSNDGVLKHLRAPVHLMFLNTMHPFEMFKANFEHVTAYVGGALKFAMYIN